ncbi:MAG: hypothetical protein PF637_06280 [Spirochaetes bacterium]|jgi:V/A-type H+-transporting ATPase subunit E|nr:hypothetical protein [Spirochaetota bacterium]
MSDNMQAAQPFETKMRDISNYLKERVLDPAQQEKQAIIASAHEESNRIIEKAREEAAKIKADAQESAIREKNSLNSALRIASKQSIDTLKIALEKSVLKQVVEKPVSQVISSGELVKEFISDVVKTAGDETLEVRLSDSLRGKIADYVRSEIIAKFSAKVTLSDESVPSGFAVILSDSQLMYDFSEESLTELLSSFVRSELRTYLFEKK